MTEPPSPAAQAVLDAAYALPLRNGQPSIAAAICALVEQTAPLDRRSRRQCNIRRAQLAIAAELEGGTTTTTTPQEAQ